MRQIVFILVFAASCLTGVVRADEVAGRAAGLRAEYFADLKLQKLILTRLDGSPVIGDADRLVFHDRDDQAVAIRFTGTLRVPADGEYTFHYRVDDEVRLWLDDELIIEQPQHHSDLRKVKATLKRGDRTIRIEYLNSGGGGALLELFWEGPTLKRQSLGEAMLSTGPWNNMDCYSREAFELDADVDKHRVPGLHGVYFEDEHFSKPAHTQRDRHVSIAGNYPIPSGRLEHIAVRWTGVLKVDKPGDYTFYSDADDGLWLWIDQRPVITQQANGRSEAKVRLSKGLHPIRIDHNQGTGGAYCEVSWSGPGFKRTVLGGEALWTRPWKDMQDPRPMLVLLMYGHSNMDGRSGGIDTFHPRTWRWEGGRQAWQRIDKDNSPAGPLLQRLAEAYPDYQFAAVKMAQSGGTIEGDFRQGRRAYKQLVDAGKAAQAFGHLAGVVTMIGWCEGGEGKTGHAAFGEDFAAMVSDLRKDLKAPDLPFVVSQVEVGNPPKNEQPEWQAVHAGIDQLPFRRQGVIVVPANRHFRDSHHYSEEGYLVWTKEAATRMAAAGVIEAAIDEQRSVTSMDARGDEVEYGVDEMLATVRGKVVLVSSPRTLEELGTYEHCLITTRYQVLDVRQGELPKGKSKHIVVIDYHIRDRKPQPAGKLKVGDTVTLELADWRAQRHLHSLAIDDDLEDLDSPQFFVLKMQR